MNRGVLWVIMSTSIMNIVQGFHNLNGITIGQRMKELFLLLNELDQTAADIDHLIQELKPNTYLENKMFIRILIHFHQEKELLAILKGGNEKLIKPLWKQKWFFDNLLRNIPIKCIVNEIFPSLSYVSRIRFLKNVVHYTSDEEKVDKLYDTVLDKYGPSNAQNVFAGCSLEKKLNILKSGHTVILSNQHLTFLYKNKKEHLQQILKLKSDCNIINFYDHHWKAFKVIAGCDDNIFIESFKANNCSCLGKRLTRKILLKEMPYVIEKAHEVHAKFHQRSLLKCLKSNFEEFFLSTWPSSFKSFRLYHCISLLKFYPRAKYVEIIQKGLRKMYNTSLLENPDLIDEVLLANTKNIQLRESLLEIKMHNSKDEYTLAQYYGIEKSIPILKKKISAADGVRTRDNLISALVNTCSINDDVNALLRVQEYFYFRHKNDDDTIRSTFLYELMKCFDLTSLTDEHWKLIFELLKWHIMKNGTYCAGDFYMLHIKYLYKNNATEEVINNLLFNDNYLASILKSFTTAWKLIDDIPKLQKYFIEMFMKPLPPSFYKSDEKTDLYFKFFKVILIWNKNNPSDKINYCLCSDIKESIKITLEKPCNSYSIDWDLLINFIKGKIPCDDKQFLLEIEQILWNKLPNNFNSNAIEYYLRNDPLRIVKNFDVFMSSMRAAYSYETFTIWRLLKQYDHLGLVEKVIQTLELDLFGSIEIGLATLIPSDEYIKYLVAHKTEMLDVDDKEQVRKHRLAVEFLRYAKYNDSPTILPCIMEYCQGDSLHDALTPLYYYFFHTPEINLLEHLEILSDRAVSVRKHAVKLACAVSPVEIVYTLIKRMTEGEKNQSVLEHMYWKTFKYFLSDRSEKFWFLLQLQLNCLDISESNAFKESCSLTNVPKAFRQSYFDFIWKLLDDREKQEVDVSDFKESLIRSLTREMFKELSYDFCSVFIKEKFLKFQSKSQNTIQSFVLDCLKYCPQRELLLSDVFNVITEYKNNYILHSEFNISCKSRSHLSRFVSEFFYNHEYFDFATTVAFCNNWVKIFPATEDIHSFIKLVLLVELHEVNNVDMYVAKVAELFTKFSNEFGILGIVDCIKDVVCDLLPNTIFDTHDSDEKLYKLALKLTELENSHLNLLAITLLPRKIPENNYCIQTQSKLLEILGKSKDKSVLINLNLYTSSVY